MLIALAQKILLKRAENVRISPSMPGKANSRWFCLEDLIYFCLGTWSIVACFRASLQLVMRDEVESVLERRLDKQKVGYLLLLP